MKSIDLVYRGSAWVTKIMVVSYHSTRDSLKPSSNLNTSSFDGKVTAKTVEMGNGKPFLSCLGSSLLGLPYICCDWMVLILIVVQSEIPLLGQN